MKIWEHYKKAFFVASVLVVIILIGNKKEVELSPISSVSIFDEYDFSAKAIFIIDEMNDEILFEKDSDRSLEIASITKLMTALIAIEEMPKKSITIDPESFFSEGDTGLLINERWEIEDLVTFMLTNSSNDAAEAIAKSYPRGRLKFIERMNDRARELGLMTMIYNNPTGLNETDEFGGKGSASDVASLLSYLYKKNPKIFLGTTKSDFMISSFDSMHKAENTNLVANSLLGIQAGKTGYTDQAGGSLVVRFNLGLDTPVTAVVLGAEGRDSRFVDIQNLIKATALKALE